MHRKRVLRFVKSPLVEIETWASADEYVRYGRRTCWGADGKVSIERWYLSPYVEKTFNSKVIKSFLPELRSRKCLVFFFFCVSGFLCYHVCALWTFYVYFTYLYIFTSGYVTAVFFVCFCSHWCYLYLLWLLY